MSYSKKEFFAPSSDGIHTLSGVVYLPEGKPCGYLHVVHGMTEHIGRYDRFMSDMAEVGYICFGFDNLGHGRTARDDGELGFIAKKGGSELLARDVKIFSDAVRKEYGEEIPYFLLGHSMGSFIVRAAAKEVHPDKLIVMGTAGKNPAAGAGLMLIALIKLFCGERHFSPLIDKIAFGSYNERFGGGSADDPKPWLTNDAEVRKKYYADKFCTFNFSVSAMGDLIRLIKDVNCKAWYESFPKDVSLLLVSGSDDPVGGYGNGVREVCEGVKDHGADASCILYDGARHEILNDITYNKVKEDILKFLHG
ncbi:MAG: alpha/beta fold hydrolase [Clostridia bacterium]|nr:alpha/beta fold hydrolase [Clostridia bacterium]